LYIKAYETTGALNEKKPTPVLRWNELTVIFTSKARPGTRAADAWHFTDEVESHDEVSQIVV
jgi:hypothetical protein